MGRKRKEPEQQEIAERGLEVIGGELGTASKIRHVRSEGSLGVAGGKIYDEGKVDVEWKVLYNGGTQSKFAGTLFTRWLIGRFKIRRVRTLL